MGEPGIAEATVNADISLLLIDSALPKFDEGELPLELQDFRHKLQWPLKRSQAKIYLAAFYGGPDLVMKERQHEGVDFHVEAGAPIQCIEDGQVAYGVDDERGNFGDLLIQGTQTRIMYRYCHIDLDSMPWDWRKLWGDKRERPMVKAGDILGNVSPWFRDLPPDLDIPEEVEAVFGRKRDHLHLETEYNPHPYATKEYLYAKPIVFNPLLVLQKPEEYFRK